MFVIDYLGTLGPVSLSKRIANLEGILRDAENGSMDKWIDELVRHE